MLLYGDIVRDSAVLNPDGSSLFIRAEKPDNYGTARLPEPIALS